VDRLAHHPGPKQGALLGAGPFDVRRREATAARAERERTGVDVLGLRAGDRLRDLGGIAGAGGTVEELLGAADTRQALRIDQ
jgi:hypothetical protein